MALVEPFLCSLQPQEAATCKAMLRVCASWRPGPAGRGGDRALKASPCGRKRSSPDAAAHEEVRRVRRKHFSSSGTSGTDDESEDEDDDTVVASARRCNQEPATFDHFSRAIVPLSASPTARSKATTKLWPGLSAPELRQAPVQATRAHAPAGLDGSQPAHTPLAAATVLGRDLGRDLGQDRGDVQMSASDILQCLVNPKP